MNVSSVRRLSFGVSLLVAFFVMSTPAGAVSPDVVISQIYGGGGNSGATYTHDFIELFNRGTTSVSLAGWTVQYGSATGNIGPNSSQVTELSGTLLAGQYLLIQEAQGAGGTTPLPAPDVTDATPIAMSATAGKVALVPSTTPLNCGASATPCSPTQLAGIKDLVGYGTTANLFEGGPAPALTNTTAALRAGSGCTDTDNNSADFSAGTPNPRNRASTFNVCPALPTNPSGVGSATPSTVAPGESTLLRVTVTPGSNPTSTGLAVTGDLSAIGGLATQTFFDDATNGDVTADDNVFSFQATVSAATSPGNKSLPTTITDAEGRSGSAPIPLSVVALVEIFQIQGNGLASPFVGQAVKTLDNVVTAVVNNGFFIQTPSARADADPETSNGVFVFTSSAPTVVVGDQVDVSASVVEFFNMTQLSGPTVSVDSTGNPLPAVVTLNATTPSPDQPQPATEMERFEGMLVRVENGVASSPTNQFGETSIVARSTRAFREPGILFPGISGLPVWDGNPEIFEIDTDPVGISTAIPGGAVISVAEGPLGFSFGDYQIWPTALIVAGEAEVVAVRDRNASEFTVGSQNLLRLFDTVNDPTTDDPVPTAQQYADRLNKFSLLIRGALKAPDVLVVQEAENLTVLQDLAAKIQADDPTLVYSAHLLEGNDIGGIDIGFLVRPTVQVDSVEQFGEDDVFEFPGAPDAPLNDRPPLVLRGSYVGGAVPYPLTVIGVHQRSLSGIEGSDGPRVRAKRHAQAVRLSELIQSLQEESGARVAVIGDFNAFEFTDGYVDVMGQVTGLPDPQGALLPVDPSALPSPALTNQTFSMPAPERYSFVFDGTAQSLDHAITTQTLDPFLRGAHHSRGNADSPFSFEDDPTTSLRSSDHDGTVLFVMGDNDGDGFPDDGDACVASSTSATVVIDGCNSGAGNDLFSDGCKITDRVDACAAAATTHEQFTGCITQLTNQLRKDGFITNKEKSAIQMCAGRARIP